MKPYYATMTPRIGGHGFGNVGLGVGGDPSPTRTRPDLCAGVGHPGVTYNPWHDITACLCGARWQDGNNVDWDHVSCLPLTERVTP